MKGVSPVNRVNLVDGKWSLSTLPPSISSALSRFRTLQNNPINPENPPGAQSRPAETGPACPPFEPERVALAQDEPILTPDQAEAIVRAVSSQPPANIAWVSALAARYDAARPNWPGFLCERRACIDLLLWQARFQLDGKPAADHLPCLLRSLGVDPTLPSNDGKLFDTLLGGQTATPAVDSIGKKMKTPRHAGPKDDKQETRAAPAIDGVLIVDRTHLAGIAAAITRAGQPVALDIETYAGQKGSTDPWRGDIRLLSLAVPGHQPWLLDLKAIGYDLGPLAGALQAATVLGHNLKFDALWLLMKCGIRLPAMLDTMTASRLLTAGTHEKNSLEAIVERHLGIQLDKAAQSAPWGGQLTPAHLRYAAADVANLHPLHDALARQFASTGLADVYRLEMELLPHVVDMEGRGFPVDRDALQRHLDAALHDRNAAADRLRELFGSPHLNPASNPQLKAALAAKGIAVESTAEGALIEAKDQTYIPAILAYRGAAKRGSQAEGLLKAVQADGRIHSRFEPMGTDTGRFSSRDPNLQNIERGAIRAAFAAPAGHSLVVADYSQIELRVAAAVAGETKMIEAYRQRTDLHRLTAAVVLGKQPDEVTKQDRQLAKAVNFGLLYGQSAPGLVRYAKASYQVDLTEDRARVIRNRFFTAYPRLKAWQDANGAAAARATEARTVTGRRQLLTPGDEFRWSRFASSLNTPVQGGAADGIKRAIILIAQRLPPGSGLISTVHDELIALAPTDRAEEVKAAVETCMIEAMASLFPAVPVEVECAVCQNWGEKK